jgi:hypothetical protein
LAILQLSIASIFSFVFLADDATALLEWIPLVILLVIIGALGYWFYRNRQLFQR